ncbi:hypothetical protein TESG_08202 [Trichophyton tonsurans CBS 112818]|uniref:Aminoglycoside phosphotransferase domain-containing protein n=1 Tax=Trichophyton tonsurans (strain CBS 112818) TaxID=647933 RepID=F2SBG4_TRIT1|nr:hypothetical protein TESG_08202 [Trichophyton tonsurans CBS 112818]
MWTPVELPYFCGTDGLPAPLPTTDEIMTSTTLLKDRLGQKMVRVGQHFVVKYGHGTGEVEGHNLLLKDMFDGMHSLPSPGFYGSIVKGYMPRHLFYSHPADQSISGPFLHENEVNNAIAGKLRSIFTHNKKYNYKSDFYERHLSRVLSGHRAVFSHSDIYRKNIMIHKTHRHTPEKCDYIVALVDWEYAGWYPSYWDYEISFTHFHWDDDWPERFESFLEPWLAEVALIKSRLERSAHLQEK